MNIALDALMSAGLVAGFLGVLFNAAPVIEFYLNIVDKGLF